MFDNVNPVNAFRGLTIATCMRSYRGYDRAQKMSSIKGISSLGMRFALEYTREYKLFPDNKFDMDDFEAGALYGKDLKTVIKTTSKYISDYLPDQLMYNLVQYLYLSVNPPADYKDPGDSKPFTQKDSDLLKKVFHRLEIPESKVLLAIQNCPENFIGSY